ncbi:hypothetical protein [uncultured Dokdonia sp.]|nr:hypothetical protein [uncultured Dokdonia sp.]
MNDIFAYRFVHWMLYLVITGFKKGIGRNYAFAKAYTATFTT